MDQNIKELIKYGYFKFKLNPQYQKKNLKILRKIISKKIKAKNLEDFHKICHEKDLNKIRLYIFSQINKSKEFKKNLYLSSKKFIDECVGNEICTSDINLSIQFPNDSSSLLDMHSDFFSGESLFQINLWTPYVDVKKTQSMFIINPRTSLKIIKNIKNNKNLSFKKIFEKNKREIKWINVKLGEAILFSPNCLHGNVVNKEKKTRWSTNIRFKNIFSPYTKFRNEKEIGNFYKPYSLKGITMFNLKHNFNEIIK